MELKDKILRYTTFALLFLATFVYFSHRLYPHISSKTFFIYALIEIIFFTWVYNVITDNSYRIPKRGFLWFIPSTIFILWMTIAGIYGVNPSMSFWSSLARGTGLLTLYHCFALSIVIASLVQKYGRSFINSLFKYFIFGSVIGAISVWMGPGGFGFNILALNTGGEGGLFGNSSLAAVYMIFAVIFSIYLIIDKDFDKKLKKWIVVAVCIMLLSPLFINVSGLFNGYGLLGTARGSIIAIPVIGFVTIILYFILSSKKYLKIFGIIAATIGILVFSYLWIDLTTPNTYLHNRFEEVARGSRFIFWDIAGKSIDQSPLIGYGPENYFILFQKNFNPDSLLGKNSMEGFGDRAHNIYFDLGVSGGYPAIILYALTLIILIYALYKGKNRGNLTQLQASVLGSLIIGYIFQNLFTFESNLSMMAMFLLSGILFGLDSYSSNNVDKVKSQANYIAMGGIIILFLVCWTLFAYMPAKKSKLYAETFASSIDRRESMYNNLLTGPSIGRDWDVSGLAFDTYRMYSSNASVIKNDKEKIQLHIKNLESLLEYLYKVSEVNKTDYRLYISIANLENTLTYLSGRPISQDYKNKLLNILDKAKSLSPTNPNVYWAIAQVKVWTGDFKGTEEAYKEGIKVAPGLPGSYTLFLKYLQATGNQRLFNEIMIKAKENVKDFTFS